jgi:NAD-dependent deacetylase
MTMSWAAGVSRVAVLTGAGISTDSGNIVNRDPTPYDDLAVEVIREPISEALPRICAALS